MTCNAFCVSMDVLVDALKEMQTLPALVILICTYIHLLSAIWESEPCSLKQKLGKYGIVFFQIFKVEKPFKIIT